MTNLSRSLVVPCLFLALGCGEDKKVELAAEASGTALQSSAPQTAAAVAFKAKKAGSVSFLMEAPIEKIFGKVPDATDGTLYVDVSDLSKTTGNVAVDLSTLKITQQKRKDEKDEKSDFGEEKEETKQNEHAREWLEIDDKVAEEKRTKNKRVEFRITSIKSVSKKDVSAEKGPTTVAVVADGEFLLHTRVSKKSVELDVTLDMDGGKAKSIKVKTKTPFAANLPEHDIGPRDDVGKILSGVLAKKVGKDAMVSLDFEFTP